MYKQCTTEVTTQRQRMLEHCLLDLLKRDSYDHITVGDICASANVPRGMFYRYFDSKKDALDALIDHTLVEYMITIDFTENSQSEDPLGICKLLLYWKSQKPLLDALDFSGISELLMKRMLVYAMSGPGVIRHFLTYRNSNLAAEEYAMTFGVCGLASIAFEWHRRGYQQRKDRPCAQGGICRGQAL